MVSPSHNWEFVFLLHNLQLKEAFECEFMAIVPNNDARIRKIAVDVPAVGSLMQNFTDQRGKQRYPCALLIRKDAPGSIKSLDAIVSFRNIFALSCLLYAWPRTVGTPNVFFPLWSDFFDFHPTSLTRDPKFLHIFSSATDGACLPQDFRGQVSPNLPNANHFRFQPDDEVRAPLLEVWKRAFTGADPLDWKTLVQFRSLEMAYQATSVPTNSRSTIYDFGSRIALWIGAFEVLVHPGGEKGRAGLKKVIDLLQEASWHDPRLKKPEHEIEIRGKGVHVNLVQKLYDELYNARNAFMHGNPVSRSRLFCFCNENRPSLIEIAPLIYKVALSCFHGQSYNTKPRRGEAPNLKDVFDRHRLEKVLLSTLENRGRGVTH